MWRPEPAELATSSPRMYNPYPLGSPSDDQGVIELPERPSPPAKNYATPVPNIGEHPTMRRQPAREPSDVYVEDVDPRFANTDPPQLPAIEVSSAPLSPSYHPLPQHHSTAAYNSESLLDPIGNRVDNRSPAQSEGSNFTSISQRGPNPNWEPGPGSRAPPPSRFQENILAANPDFSLPGIARRPVGGPARGGGHMRATSRGSHHYYDGM